MWGRGSNTPPNLNVNTDENFPTLGGPNARQAPSRAGQRSIQQASAQSMSAIVQNPIRPSGSLQQPQTMRPSSEPVTARPAAQTLPSTDWESHDHSPMYTNNEAKKKAKKVPPELIKGFVEGTKNPVSAIMEYTAMCRYNTTFQECGVNNPNMLMRFACVCTVDGKEYPQGQGKTKKEAKTNAARIAFSEILGLDVDHDEPESLRVVYDSMGRKIAIQHNGMSDGSPLVTSIDQQEDPQQVMSAAGALCRNPVSVLQEFCQKKRMPFTLEVGDVAGPNGFVAFVTVNNETDPISTGSAKTKREARRLAADSAVRQLMQLDSPQLPEEEATLFDKISNFATRKLYELLQFIPEYLAGRIIVAAFIIDRGDENREVVALGTGNTCINGDALSMNGRVLNDSHAEIVARRALLKYFYREIRAYYDSKPSIFTQSPTSARLLALKENVTLHLYISTAPCGDGALFSPSELRHYEREDENILEFVNDREQMALGLERVEEIENGVHLPMFSSDAHGNLRTKIETGEGTIPLDKDKEHIQTWDGLVRGDRLRTMSCSDKILRWNVLGVQGQLLTQFIEPLYITSVTLGNLFDHGHLSRAICCRLPEDIIPTLPEGYMLNHPFLGRVTLYDPPRGCEKTNSLSINWSCGDDKVEICDGRTGKSTENSPFRTGALGASRLCKAAFLHRFRDLAKYLDRPELLSAANYRAAKQGCEAYDQAKQVFRASLRERGYGYWVTKPVEQELFQK